MQHRARVASRWLPLERWILVAAAAYLVVPLLVFFVMTFRLPAAIALVALSGIGLVPLARATCRYQPPNRINVWTWLALAVVAMGLVLVGGAGHLLYANRDWWKHDAVFEALTQNPWPVTYVKQSGGDVIFRYYEGFYVVPSALAKVFGHLATWIILWEWLGMFLSLAGVAVLLRTVWQRVIGLSFFLLFSGLDIVGWYIKKRHVHLTSTTHIEQWAIMAYNSTFTLIAWVPQHAFSAWLALLILRGTARDRDFIASLAMLLVATMFWSFFVVLGLLPFLLLPIYRSLRLHGIKRSVLRIPLPIGMVVGVFLTLFLIAGAANDTRKGWIWHFYGAHRVLDNYLWFIALEVLILVVVMVLAGVRLRGAGRIAVAVMLVLPLYVVGGASSDLTMRTVIPAQFVLVLAFVDWLSEGHCAPRIVRRKVARVLVVIPLVITVAIGARTASPEVLRAFEYSDRPSFPYASQLLALVAWPLDVPDGQYLAREPAWIDRLMRHHNTVLPVQTSNLTMRSHWRGVTGRESFFVEGDALRIHVAATGDASGVVESVDSVPAGIYRIRFTLHQDAQSKPKAAFAELASNNPIRLPHAATPGDFSADEFVVVETPGVFRLHIVGNGVTPVDVRLGNLVLERIDSPLLGTVDSMIGLPG